MRETLCSLVDDARRQGGRTLFIQQQGLRVSRWSYVQFARAACRMARELEARAIGKGDRVLLWGESRSEWAAAFFGCLLRGAVAVPLDEQSTADFARRVQQQVQAKLLVCGSEQYESFGSILPVLRIDRLPEVIQQHSADPYDAHKISSDDLVEIVFTSGTTAEPKGVCLTHRNILTNLHPIEREIEKYRWLERVFRPIRFLCLLPLSHMFGQFMGIYIPQLLGGEVFFGNALKPGEIIATIRRERIAVAAAVPRQLETLRDSVEHGYASRGQLEEFQRRFTAADGKHFFLRWWMFRDLHRRLGLKFIAFVCGGATLDETTESFWRRLGFAVIQGYGLTETASVISINHPFKPSHGSIGKTLEGMEVKLTEEGEILVRGESVSPGYWQAGGGAAPSPEGWLRTGDIAERDAQGNLFFKGRQKDVIVTGAGVNVYPEDLEAELNQQPEVRASCVLGAEGAGGPEPFAVLILRDDKADPADIIRRANARLNTSQQIRRWSVWNEPDFPRTPTQKIRKTLVRDQVFGQGVSRRNGVVLGGRDLKELDSLGRVALLAELEEKYQVELDEASLTPQTTAEELERMIRTQADGAEPALEYPYPRWSLRAPVNWLRQLLYFVLIVPFVAVMCRPRVLGRERLRHLRGPILFISNHVAMVDSGLLLFAMPWRFKLRLAQAMGGERLRGFRHGLEHKSWIGRIVDRATYLLIVLVFNVFAIPQKSGFRRSFAYAGEAIDRGFNVLFFPEGRTTRDGKLSPFMSGIGLLASDLNVPVVPIRISGLWEVYQKHRYLSRPGTVSVTFGEPVEYPKGTDPAEITRDLEQRVREL